jgi:hypothetical protein
MAIKHITWRGFLRRFVVALLLVFASYNPSGISYFHWIPKVSSNYNVLAIFIGIVLLIGWVVYLRATFRSLGVFGLILAAAFFGSLLWLIIDWGLISGDDDIVISYILLILLSGILAVGMSWSHIRRRISGQADVDDVETH